MNTKILLLAAGKGKRMNSDFPKVLVSLNNKPLISYLLDSISKLNFDVKPAIVVGYKADLVKSTLGDQYEYITQDQQLGTGHAVMCARDALQGKYDNILVLYGDMPFLTPATILNIIQSHEESNAVMTMATLVVDDFDKWRAGFYDFGRIVRDVNGGVSKIVEKKDATPDELGIKEVNPSYFCFKSNWLWENIEKLKNENSQGEYYLTELPELAMKQGQTINTVQIDLHEGLGVNTPEQLEIAKDVL